MSQGVNKQTYERLPLYLNYLKSLPEGSPPTISATAIAETLKLNDVQVRKDLSVVGSGSKPKIGYVARDLIYDIEEYLGYHDTNYAVLVGAGSLGRALLCYEGFKNYGLEIQAAFDNNNRVIGEKINNITVYSIDDIHTVINKLDASIGIITVPKENAQEVCDILLKCNIKAIWNFSNTHIHTPPHIPVRNEDLGASLAALSRKLGRRGDGETLGKPISL